MQKRGVSPRLVIGAGAVRNGNFDEKGDSFVTEIVLNVQQP